MELLAATLIGAAGAAAPVWVVSATARADAGTEVQGQPHRPARRTVEARRAGDGANGLVLRHDFRDLDLPQVAGTGADSNGFVHRLSGQWRQEAAGLRWRAGAVLAVSSNVLRAPAALRPSDLRPVVELSWRQGPVWLALHADDRLGRALVYPGLSWQAQPAPGQLVELGLPASRWQWSPGGRWHSAVALDPDGACWRVRDAALQRRSTLCSRGWHAMWTVRWDDGARFGAGLTLGRRLGSALDYRLLDGRTVRAGVPDATTLSATLDLRL